MQNQRPYNISNPQGIYFVTFSVVQWVDVFTRSIYRDIVVESMKYCIEHKGLILYAWCLMSNHMHLIIGARNDHNLSDIIRDLKKFTSKRIVEAIDSENESRKSWMLWLFRSSGKRNPNNVYFQFWQQGNHAIELYSNKFMQQKLDYVHNNP